MYTTFIQDLRDRLQLPLPGIEAQALMMPDESPRDRFKIPKSNYKQGGVLILLYPTDNNVYLPLTQRHEYAGVHSGQVSLPGGRLDEDDSDIVETALRETHEEVGVPADDICILGKLTDLYIPPSNFVVTPVVGFVEERPLFTLDTHEVKELIETPLNLIMDDSIKKRKDITVRNSFRINAPYFDIKDKVVWGATAMILSEFKMLLSDILR